MSNLKWLVPSPAFRYAVPVLSALVLMTQSLVAAASDPAPPWEAMDYGPFLTASIEAPHPATNIAFKGIAINLGRNFGSPRSQAVIFDTDLLRYSAGWTGDFLALNGIAFDGEHWAYPRIAGRQIFGNPAAPGWARTDSFQDPRDFPYGPLPRAWAHWKGLYLHEHKVILAYSVGDMSVLEMPALEQHGNISAFARAFNLSQSTVTQTLQIAYEPGCLLEVLDRVQLRASLPDIPASLSIAVLAPVARREAPSAGSRLPPSRDSRLHSGGARLPPSRDSWSRLIGRFSSAGTSPYLHVLRGLQVGQGSGRAEVLGPIGDPALPEASTQQEILAAALIAGPPTARWLSTSDGHMRLVLPANSQPSSCKLLLWRGPRDALPDFAAFVEASSPPEDLAPLIRGGPARWPQKLVTRGTLGANNGPYAIDTLTEPDQNPWQSWMRFGGLDFFPDGERAALCTWSGDVWIVSGVDGDLRELVWQRIATGLFQPLGLRIVNEQIYVLGRDQITRLHDLDGDGEADFYENFNNDCMVSEHFHEFALDLKTGPDGSFYYIKCACHGTTAKHPHHGTLLKISRDGAALEVVARGFRANNGLGVGPRGELISVDNQGHWMPANRINWIQPGGWYGYQWAWNPDHRVTYDEPLLWMHNAVDRSGGTQLWVPTDAWGPFRDEIVTVSYGMGHLFLLLQQEIDGIRQGAVTRFPLEFETGVMRGAWHPINGQLYVAGLYGWAGNKTRAGGFYRIRHTGQPVHMVRSLHFARDGVVLGFTDPLDSASATDPGNYHVTAWNYRWTDEYGSPDFKLNGQEGRDIWIVESATVSADRRSVFLELPDAQRVMQVHVAFNLAFADGARADNFIHGTIHRLAETSGADLLGPGAILRESESQTTLSHPMPGLIQSFASTAQPNRQDTRVARLPALFVPSNTPPTGYLDPGPFRCRWEGFLNLDLNDEITFEMVVSGSATLTINNETVLQLDAEPSSTTSSRPIPLRAGLNRFELEFQSPAHGNAELRLAWFSQRWPLEPVPATAFLHDASSPVLVARQQSRQGREIFATHQCAGCHQPSVPWPDTAMPELSADAPDLQGIGTHLNARWIVQWLLDPKATRPDTTMPRLLSGPDAARDASDIAAFLAHSDHAPTTPPDSNPLERQPDLIHQGAGLFANLGCVACHFLPGHPTLANDPRVPLQHLADKWQHHALPLFLQAPATRYRWTRMPNFHLSPNEAAALTEFLFDRPEAVNQQNPPRLDDVHTGDPIRGRNLVATIGCLACHNLSDVRNQSPAPSLANLAESDWSDGCLAGPSETRGTAPDFDFTPEQRTALRAFAKDGFPESLLRDTPAEFADRAFASLRCSACHSRDHETDLVTRLTAISPTGLAEADVADDDSGTVHPTRPTLTHAGEKLYADWIQRLLEGSLPYKPRPELKARMPAFPPFAAGLAEGIAHQHGYPAQSAPPTTVDAQLAETGRRLTLVDGGFSCIACHNVGSQRALAGRDTATVDFTCIVERLRPDYYWRYVRNPARLVPSTMMPRFIGEDGTTPIKSVLDGDPQRQFDAIWHYLHSLRQPQAQ